MRPLAFSTLLSTTWYYYNESGNVARIVTNQAGTNDYTATRIIYAKNGHTVSFMIDESWTWTGVPGICPANYVPSGGREFRYDGARQRYFNQSFTFLYLADTWVRQSWGTTWTDYDGNEPYGDFTVAGVVATNARSFELGLATVDPWTDEDGITTSYYHSDMIGTTRHMTDGSGNPASSTTYTAFGERIDGGADRYGYAGAWGYQAHDEVPFLHVGARYYDPATGRFLQRDPIGIAGGLNVYEYADSNPLTHVDPTGLQYVTGPPPPPGPQPTPTGGDAGDIVIGAKVKVGVSGKGPYVEGEVSVSGKAKDWWDLIKTGVDVAVACVGSLVGDSFIGDFSTRDPVPPGCFVGQTLVQTPVGLTRIDQIAEGDCVLAHDRTSGLAIEATVRRVLRVLTDAVVELDIDGDRVICTGEHPFFVVGDGWLHAAAIIPGQELLRMDGTHIRVIDAGVRTLCKPIPVYTLDVLDYETFSVGICSVMVHNKVVGY